ncbi:MAG: hypothetical protein HQK49_14490 [Oligoflexia bacterium]|nr:hypothetical protein [Oligoflexia bacterium]
MKNVKTINLVVLKSLIKKKGPHAESILVKNISSSSREIYENLSGLTKVSSLVEEDIFNAAADILCPGEPDKFVAIGRILAKENMSTILKIFLLIPSAKMVIKSAAILWKTFYEEGNAGTTDEGEKTVTLVAKNCPNLVKYQMESTAGYVEVILKMTGAKNVTVTFVGTDPNAWKWIAKWD